MGQATHIILHIPCNHWIKKFQFSACNPSCSCICIFMYIYIYIYIAFLFWERYKSKDNIRCSLLSAVHFWLVKISTWYLIQAIKWKLKMHSNLLPVPNLLLVTAFWFIVGLYTHRGLHSRSILSCPIVLFWNNNTGT